MGINQVLSLVYWSKAKEGRTPLLNANNLSGKDSAVGINGFEGVELEWLLLKKESLLCFGKRAGFEGGERETDLLVHAHWTISLFSSISSLFFFIFFLIFFLFFLLCFSFLLCECSVFSPLLRVRQGPFYSACRDQCFTTLPLNRLCLVWAYLPTTKSVKHSPLPDKGRFVSFLSLP